MADLYDLKRRADELAEKVETNSVDPAEVGNLIYDTIDYVGSIEINGAQLGIKKTYPTVADMEADASPVDKKGKPLHVGSLIVINGDNSGADYGKVYRYEGKDESGKSLGWTFIQKIDEAYALKMNTCTYEDLGATSAIPETNAQDSGNEVLEGQTLGRKVQLKDKDGNEAYPVSTSECIYTPNGKMLSSELEDVKDKIIVGNIFHRVYSTTSSNFRRVIGPFAKGSTVRMYLFNINISGSDDLKFSSFIAKDNTYSNILKQINPIKAVDTVKYVDYTFQESMDEIYIGLAKNQESTVTFCEFDIQLYFIEDILKPLPFLNRNTNPNSRFITVQDNTDIPTITVMDDDSIKLSWKVLFLLDTITKNYSRNVDANIVIPRTGYFNIYTTDLGKTLKFSIIGDYKGAKPITDYKDYQPSDELTALVILVVSWGAIVSAPLLARSKYHSDIPGLKNRLSAVENIISARPHLTVKSTSHLFYRESPIDYLRWYSNCSVVIEKDDVPMVISRNCLSIKLIDSAPTVKFNCRLILSDEARLLKGKTVYIGLETFSDKAFGMTFYKNTTAVITKNIGQGYQFTVFKFDMPDLNDTDWFEGLIIAECKVGAIYFGDVEPKDGMPIAIANELNDNNDLSTVGEVYSVCNFSGYDFHKADPVVAYTIGYRYRFDRDVAIKGLLVGWYNVNVGTKVNIIAGTLDQRNWLVNQRIYAATIKKNVSLAPSEDGAINSWYIVPDKGQNAIIHKGESLYMNIPGNNGWAYTTEKANLFPDDPDKQLSTILADGVTTEIRSEVNSPLFSIIVKDLTEDTYFARKEDLDEVNTNVRLLTDKIDSSQFITDITTGDKYKILINNGQIVLKNMSYKNVWCIGNSFTFHGLNNTLWPDNRRGMASSVPENDYITHLKSGLGEGAKVYRCYGIPFERDFTPDYDINKILVPSYGETASGIPDAIVVQIGENARFNDTLQESWVNMLRNLKAKFPTADIVHVIGWYSADRTKAIYAACNEVGISVLDCTTETKTGNLRAGDYVTGQSNESFDYARPAILTHPSDIGDLLIANRILKFLGKNELDLFRNITLVQTDGGSISAPYTKWVVNGVVNIKCDANEGKSISSITVKQGETVIPATKRTNEYGTFYTFFMPDGDVNVRPFWS